MGLAVLLRPGPFSGRGTYLLAAGGMAYMNLTNMRHARALLRHAALAGGAGDGAKAHAA